MDYNYFVLAQFIPKIIIVDFKNSNFKSSDLFIKGYYY